MSINPNSVWDIVAARTVSPTPSPVKGYQGKMWGPIKNLAPNANSTEKVPTYSISTGYKPVVGGRKTRKNKRRHTKKRRSHRKN